MFTLDVCVCVNVTVKVEHCNNGNTKTNTRNGSEPILDILHWHNVERWHKRKSKRQVWTYHNKTQMQRMGFPIICINVNIAIYTILKFDANVEAYVNIDNQCRSVTAPDSLTCTSAHKVSANGWLLKLPSHIWANCHLGIAEDPFKKCALHYCDYQLPDNVYISPRITLIKGTHQC